MPVVLRRSTQRRLGIFADYAAAHIITVSYTPEQMRAGCCCIDEKTPASRAEILRCERCISQDALTQIGFDRSCPKTIRVNNGPEITSKPPDQWAHAGKVTLNFNRPGKPTDNAFIESFNGRLRAARLNENWSPTLDNARDNIEAWRQDYNNHRPHSAMGNLALEEFAQSSQTTKRPTKN